MYKPFPNKRCVDADAFKGKGTLVAEQRVRVGMGWNQQHQTMIEIAFQISERQPVAALFRAHARARVINAEMWP